MSRKVKVVSIPDTDSNDMHTLIEFFTNSGTPEQKQLARFATLAFRTSKEFALGLAEVQEQLSNLHVYIKYVLLDLEATKREKLALKNLLADLVKKEEENDENDENEVG